MRTINSKLRRDQKHLKHAICELNTCSFYPFKKSNLLTKITTCWVPPLLTWTAPLQNLIALLILITSNQIIEYHSMPVRRFPLRHSTFGLQQCRTTAAKVTSILICRVPLLIFLTLSSRTSAVPSSFQWECVFHPINLTIRNPLEFERCLAVGEINIQAVASPSPLSQDLLLGKWVWRTRKYKDTMKLTLMNKKERGRWTDGGWGSGGAM